jgi:hypothetical protein
MPGFLSLMMPGMARMPGMAKMPTGTPQLPDVKPTRLLTGEPFDESAFATPVDALKHATNLFAQGQITGDDFAGLHHRLTNKIAALAAQSPELPPTGKTAAQGNQQDFASSLGGWPPV